MGIAGVPDITGYREAVRGPERELANKIGYAIEEKERELNGLKEEYDSVLGILEETRRMAFDLRSELIEKVKGFYDLRIENAEEEIQEMGANARRLLR